MATKKIIAKEIAAKEITRLECDNKLLRAEIERLKAIKSARAFLGPDQDTVQLRRDDFEDLKDKAAKYRAALPYIDDMHGTIRDAEFGARLRAYIVNEAQRGIDAARIHRKARALELEEAERLLNFACENYRNVCRLLPCNTVDGDEAAMTDEKIANERLGGLVRRMKPGQRLQRSCDPDITTWYVHDVPYRGKGTCLEEASGPTPEEALRVAFGESDG